MAKLKLTLDDLKVESFTANTARTRRGTVNANEYTEGYTCDFNACGGTLPGACDTNMLGCGSGGHTCDQFCTGADFSCHDYRTCAAPCKLSDATNCHRCTDNQSDYSICADAQSLCVC
jgi:hypothetical protein